MDTATRAAVACLVTAALLFVAVVATAPHLAFSADVLHFVADLCNHVAAPVRAFWAALVGA